MKYGASRKNANRRVTGEQSHHTPYKTNDMSFKWPRMTQLQMRCHALQERFDDQSATLKLARESHGDMQVSCLRMLSCAMLHCHQERLIAAEMAFSVRVHFS